MRSFRLIKCRARWGQVTEDYTVSRRRPPMPRFGQHRPVERPFYFEISEYSIAVMWDMQLSVYTAFHKNVRYAGICVYSLSQKCQICRYLCIQPFTKMSDMQVSVYTAFHKNVRYAGICIYSLSQKSRHSNNFLHIFAVLIIQCCWCWAEIFSQFRSPYLDTTVEV